MAKLKNFIDRDGYIGQGPLGKPPFDRMDSAHRTSMYAIITMDITRAKKVVDGCFNFETSSWRRHPTGEFKDDSCSFYRPHTADTASSWTSESRDLAVHCLAMCAYFGLLSPIINKWWDLKKRSWFRYRNLLRLDGTPTATRDLMSPEDLIIYSTIFSPFWAFLARNFAGFYMILGSIVAVIQSYFKKKDVDENTMIMRHWVGMDNPLVKISWFIRSFRYKGLAWATRQYYREEAGGSPEFGELVIKRFRLR